MDYLNEEHICIPHPFACMLCLLSSYLCSNSHMLITFFSLKLFTRITRLLILSMSLRLDTHKFQDTYLQQPRSWMIVFEKLLLFIF
jgi:hypothetical protein